MSQEVPYAFIQWKGTDVCADGYCECGEQFHIDGISLYAVKCGVCGREYALEPYVRLVPNADKFYPVWCRPEDGE